MLKDQSNCLWKLKDREVVEEFKLMNVGILVISEIKQKSKGAEDLVMLPFLEWSEKGKKQK